MTTHAQYRWAELVRRRAWLTQQLRRYPPDGRVSRNFVNRILRQALASGIETINYALAGTCPEDPEMQRHAPIGMYHCPWCGCMVIAGRPHTAHDDGCFLGLDDIPPVPPVLRHVPTEGGRTLCGLPVDPPKIPTHEESEEQIAHGTSGGVELTDAVIESFAEEAEEGYAVERLQRRIAEGES